jgi:hypothetical protein
VGASFNQHGRAESPPPHVMLEIFMRHGVRPWRMRGCSEKDGSGFRAQRLRLNILRMINAFSCVIGCATKRIIGCLKKGVPGLKSRFLEILRVFEPRSKFSLNSKAQ